MSNNPSRHEGWRSVHGHTLGLTAQRQISTAIRRQPPGAYSMDILQELLEPVPVHEFLHRTFTCVPFAMPDRAVRYTHEFTEADIAAVVEDGRSVLRIVRNGRLVYENPVWLGKRRRGIIVAAIPCSCGMPNGPLPSSRYSPRRSRSFSTLPLISKSI